MMEVLAKPSTDEVLRLIAGILENIDGTGRHALAGRRLDGPRVAHQDVEVAHGDAVVGGLDETGCLVGDRVAVRITAAIL